MPHSGELPNPSIISVVMNRLGHWHPNSQCHRVPAQAIEAFIRPMVVQGMLNHSMANFPGQIRTTPPAQGRAKAAGFQERLARQIPDPSGSSAPRPDSNFLSRSKQLTVLLNSGSRI